MATEIRSPLRWEQSAQPCQPTVSETLPGEVVTCLQNARFLHLATCTNNTPHVSLMNYTYLPSHSFPSSSNLPSGPLIVMTSNPSSKKSTNLISNPNVSLLVHDWVSSRPPNTSTAGDRRDRSPAGGPRSSLAAMLMQMNSAAVSSISATINGSAYVLSPGSPEEKWCKEQHLANNTFAETMDGGAGVELLATSPTQTSVAGDGGKASYIDHEEVRVVVVRISDGRISDWRGGVKDWIVEDKEPRTVGGGAITAVNGVPPVPTALPDGQSLLQ